MTITIIFTFLLFAGFITYMYFTYKKIKNTPEEETNSAIKQLSDANFQAQVKNGVTLVDFWAAWCMPCKMMAPVLNETAEALGNTAQIAKLDVDSNRESSAKYGVRSIPTLILFKNGKEVNRFVGVKTKDFLLKEISKVV
ncbi:MAG: thioredoxin [Bacteroidales bacterium]|nr:thioredoxin [Bacteroidales bacterium]